MQACNHTWRSSAGNLQTCVCGKVRATTKGEDTEMQNEQNIRVIKKVAPKAQLVGVGEKGCAILGSEELVRRFMELRRQFKAFESFMRTQGLDLKSE